MKIRVKDYSDTALEADNGREPLPLRDVVELDVRAREVELVGVYNGVGIRCDQGYIGVVQRDAGVEVLVDGKLAWSSCHGTFTSRGMVKVVEEDGMIKVLLEGRVVHEEPSAPTDSESDGDTASS